MRELGTDSVVVIGGEDGRPRAFLNVCRHRGARIVEETEGQVRKRIRCPYHAWSYGLDGTLVAAPHMDGVEDFDFSCCGLLAVRSAVVGGLVLIDLSRRGAAIRRARRRPRRPPRALPGARARARRRHRLRGGGELEGHRRELQRVPALPRRPPGAERAQRLHERRRRLRRGRLVRRLDDPERGRRDDGARTTGHASAPPADRRACGREDINSVSTSPSSRTRSSRCIPTT